MAFSWIDLAVVIAYVIAITAFGARFRKGQRTLHDYFLGGNRLPWWAITLSIVCAETSILTIISTPGISYRSNLGFLQLVFGYLVARVVVSFLFIPRYFAGELYTAYQLIERRFGHGLRLFTAGLFLLTRALAEGVRVFAISIVIAIIFKTGVVASLLIIFVLTLLYTLEGGLTAVIWTDVIQLTIYIAGTVVALFVALHTLPGGWGEVVRVAQAAGGKFTVFNFHFDWSQPYLFWTGLVGGMFLNTASHGTDQLVVQQLLAARSRRQSQGALLASGVVVLLQFTLFLVVGVVLYAFYQRFPVSFSRPDQIYPTFVITRLPVGLCGLLTAAILAAGMANLSAALNSLASSSVMDFYKPFARPRTDDRHYLRVSRLATLAWGVVIITIALAAQYLQRSALELALTVASVPYGSMLGIFLLGVLTRRANSRGALVGALCALATLGYVMRYTSIAWTWYVAIGTMVTFFVGLAVSRATSSRLARET
ncbi:MAG: sodium:solute symporter [Terriglobia bacterium]